MSKQKNLGPEHLQYPERHYGMDHNHYDWQMLSERPPVKWNEGKLALWVNVSLQFFPLNQRGFPFPPAGGMTMPYPDLRHFSLRDYGNRVGVYRVLRALDRYGVRPTFAVNGELAQRTPYLMDLLRERGDEIIAHGWNMDSPHYGGQPRDEEAQLIARTLDTLRAATGQEVTGWLSPGKIHSENTPALLAAHGVEYFCDWVNDDMPYRFRTDSGELWAMPLSTELEDQFILRNNLHSETSYAEQIEDACRFLLAEARAQGGRILALNIHPWMLGQPHRIGYLERILEFVTAQHGVFSAPADALLKQCKQSECEPA
ncbi:polysaccharide deacetylase family protein [Microbulbifer hydrolyticus]|uniref:Peptidoglycan/xylan/chitin deacetylase (PgdA/CDA1 family) n=1 Tax=Microbulbifer hydrolyticus TaxID=48074 RepID=A0A6P1TC62_9GAMM|nr:polysaccharide deacetylase family protein [Microbulbifer hydrolyticus]MBB5210170.1 peptidoglycan/xylan/chitin deacetylase (PgdA/CDA1 family) [Microbulbifer hydrolyticus]QHQ39315.1 polysaccharide deacetylase family protein [Microbulbifer hydrolyticus]